MTLKKAFHLELSSPAITGYISKLWFQHFSFIACKKGIKTSSSSLSYTISNVTPLREFIRNDKICWWKVVLVCFVCCINAYNFMRLLFKHCQLLLWLKSKDKHDVLPFNIVVYFRFNQCFFPLRLINSNYVKVLLLRHFTIKNVEVLSS